MENGPFDEAIRNARLVEQNEKNRERELKEKPFIIQKPQPVATAENILLNIPNSSFVQNAVKKTGTGMTEGSIVFVDNKGQLAQNNSKLFWDNTGLKLEVTGTVEANGNGYYIGDFRALSADANDTALFCGATRYVFYNNAQSAALASLYNTGHLEMSETVDNTPTLSLSGGMFVSGGALWYKGFAGTYTLLGAS